MSQAMRGPNTRQHTSKTLHSSTRQYAVRQYKAIRGSIVQYKAVRSHLYIAIVLPYELVLVLPQHGGHIDCKYCI